MGRPSRVETWPSRVTNVCVRMRIGAGSPSAEVEVTCLELPEHGRR
jgi:hypothetical protein